MIQGSGMAVMKNEGWRYCSGWGVCWMVNSMNDFSWTCPWHWYGLVVLTPRMVRKTNGDMMNIRTQLESIIVMEWKCHVQEWPATNKILQVFFPFFPVISDQYLFIFFKLEEDNIYLVYNLPFGKTYHYVFSEPSVSETLSYLGGQVFRYCFNEFNDKDNSEIFLLRVF